MWYHWREGRREAEGRGNERVSHGDTSIIRRDSKEQQLQERGGEGGYDRSAKQK